MNCIDFRRLVLVDPRQVSEDARAHADECAACREVLERQRESDDRLFAGLQVPVPDGLADRILVARGRAPTNKRWMWAAAATLVLASGIALVGRGLLEKDALGGEAITHVASEQQSFTTIDTVDSGFLPAVLAEQGLKTIVNFGQVTYTRLCPMDGRVARHLVVRTADGPVTLFLMPDDPNARKRLVTERDGMAAVTLPAAKGSIAIVAASLGQALKIERALTRT